MFHKTRRMLTMLAPIMMMASCRKRRAGRRREIKAVSVDAVDAQAAFCHHFKSSSPPTQNDDVESPRTAAHSLPLPVQLNPDAPVSGPFKLVSRSTCRETPGLSQCPVCYDVLVPVTGTSQPRSHVTAGNDVTRRRPILAARTGDRGRFLVTNSVGHINNFNFISSV